MFVSAKRTYASITKRLVSDLDAAFYLVLTFLFIPHGQAFPPFKGAGDYKARYLQTKWLVRFVLAVMLITARRRLVAVSGGVTSGDHVLSSVLCSPVRP